jgi:folate-binding protein YgfZ
MRTLAQDEQVSVISANTQAEFQALVSGCGIYRCDRALISLTGADRVRWLNGMVTNNIRDLVSGHGVYAFVLNPQGHIQADVYAFHRGESVLVETEASQRETLLQVFDRYIIMDDVEVEDLSGKVRLVGVTGPRSAEVIAHAGWKVPELAPLQFTEVEGSGGKATVVRGDNPLVPSYELWLAEEDTKSAWSRLLDAGALEVHEPALETFRVASGIPKLGVDIRQRDLPQETGQDRALNFSKGCYIGQEIVERIRSRGAVHRSFVGFEVESSVPGVGTKVQNEGKDVGEITSVATLPTEVGVRIAALGYLRKEFMSPEKELTAGDVRIRVMTLPFSKT